MKLFVLLGKDYPRFTYNKEDIMAFGLFKKKETGADSIFYGGKYLRRTQIMNGQRLWPAKTGRFLQSVMMKILWNSRKNRQLLWILRESTCFLDLLIRQAILPWRFLKNAVFILIKKLLLKSLQQI